MLVNFPSTLISAHAILVNEGRLQMPARRHGVRQGETTLFWRSQLSAEAAGCAGSRRWRPSARDGTGCDEALEGACVFCDPRFAPETTLRIPKGIAGLD